jgi:hypothetical protein
MSDLERFERSVRDELTERSFPWEEGEMDHVQAVIATHNATSTARRAIRWWHAGLVILPVAAFWWWAHTETGSTTDVEHAPNARVQQELPAVSAEPRINADEARTSTSTQTPNSAHVQQPLPVVASASQTQADEARIAASAQATNSPQVQQPLPSVAAKPQVPVDGSRITASVQAPKRAKDQERVATAQVNPSNGGETSAAAPDPLMKLAEQAPTAADVSHGAPRAADRSSVRALTPVDNTDGASITAQAAEVATNTVDRQLMPEHMALRNAHLLAEPDLVAGAPALASAPFDAEAFRPRPSGELHAFYVPLANTSTRGGDKAGGDGTGSFFGFEYRVKHKRFSVSTGFHYTAYRLNSPAATNLEGPFASRVEYIGVPLLMGVEKRIHRFGVLLQGGVELNFLFHAAGTYGNLSAQQGASLADKQFSPIVVSALVRPQLTYQATEYLGVSAGPVWVQQLTTLAREGPLGDQRAQSFGLGAGLVWHLRRSTF